AINYAGGVPISMDTAEMYGAFDRGVLDALHYYVNPLESFGVLELIEFGTTDLQFGSVPVGLMINEELFQGLDKELQDVLIQAGQETAGYAANKHDEDVEKLEAELVESGITMHEFSEDEKKQWQEVFDGFTADYLADKD